MCVFHFYFHIQEFDFAIVTDSVSVSLCFVKPEQQCQPLSNDEIKTMYENHQFTFVLGIDPGVRTWNATVRKHILSGVEVNECVPLFMFFSPSF